MSLTTTINKLKSVANDAKDLFDKLKDLADKGKEATKTQKDNIERLASKLDTESRNAARERLKADIEQLSDIIERNERILAVPGLSRNARDAVRADKVRKLAKRARLRATLGTDFAGILNANEVKKIVELVAKAKKEVRIKKFAADFLDSAVKIADLALRIAGKVAM